MNTMKKEDMQKEQGQMIMQIGYLTMSILQPFSQLLGAVGRVAYLQNQIDLVTPKKPTAVPEAPGPKLDMETKNDKLDTEKTSA